MIESFGDRETEQIFNGLNSKKYRTIQKIAKRKTRYDTLCLQRTGFTCSARKQI